MGTEKNDNFGIVGNESRRYHGLLEKLREGIVVVDPDEAVTFANPAADRIFGVEIGKLVGQNLRGFVNDAEWQKLMEQAGLRRIGEASTYEFTITRTDGKQRILSISASPEIDGTGVFTGSFGLVQDITETKQIEIELSEAKRELEHLLAERTAAQKESEEQYGELLQNLPVGVLRTTPEGRLVSVNPAVVQMLGYESKTEVQAMNASDIYADSGQRDALFTQLAEKGSVENFIIRALRKDRSKIWLSISIRAVLNADGNISHLDGICIDITERKVAEEAVRESEQRYKSLFHNLQAGFALHQVVLDDEGTPVDYIFLDVNAAFEKQTSLRKEDLVGKRVTEALPGIEKDPADWIGKYGKVALTGNSIAFENRAEALNKWYSVVAYRPNEGQFAVLFHDITESKLADEAHAQLNEELSATNEELEVQYEELAATNQNLLDSQAELKASEDRFMDVFYSTSDALLLIDGETFVDCNDAVVTMLGYTNREQFLNTHPSELSPPTQPDGRESFEKAGEMMRLAMENGFHRFEWEHRKSDGKDFPVEVTLILVIHKGKSILHCAWKDLTKQKLAGEALRLKDTIFESAAVANSTSDPEGTITHVNRAFLEMWGYESMEEAIGNSVASFFVNEVDAAQVLEALETRGRWQGEFLAKRKDGTEFFSQGNATVVHNAEGERIGYYSANYDITDRKQAEEERLSLERQVLQAQKLESLGIMAGGIAHDFNNLLMVIMGNADLALDELSPHAPARENIAEIEIAARRAAGLAKQMLAYSGKGKFTNEVIELNGFVQEMSHLLEVSISKKAVLKYNYADSLPPIVGDATQIRQIIMNLIINASEAVGAASGVISISTGQMDCNRNYLDSAGQAMKIGIADPLPEGRYVYIEVADTGCGMDQETLEKIYDPFFTTKFTGRGLGLAAVQGIVRGHKGALNIYSELGKGTTFKVLFPEPKDGTDGIAGISQNKQSKWRGSGTILIADDEESILAIGKRMLVRIGFEVLTAKDGREALEVFREHCNEITLVLLDLTMPHKDGHEVFREMRAICPGVKVLLCSGFNEQEATLRFKGKGLAGFVQKPFTSAELIDELRHVLGS